MVTIFDLIDVNNGSDFPIVSSVLDRFAQLNLSPQKVATATDEDLAILGFAEEQIVYMRRQLKKAGKLVLEN